MNNSNNKHVNKQEYHQSFIPKIVIGNLLKLKNEYVAFLSFSSCLLEIESIICVLETEKTQKLTVSILDY